MSLTREQSRSSTSSSRSLDRILSEARGQGFRIVLDHRVVERYDTQVDFLDWADVEPRVVVAIHTGYATMYVRKCSETIFEATCYADSGDILKKEVFRNQAITPSFIKAYRWLHEDEARAWSRRKVYVDGFMRSFYVRDRSHFDLYYQDAPDENNRTNTAFCLDKKNALLDLDEALTELKEQLAEEEKAVRWRREQAERNEMRYGDGYAW